MSVKAKYMIINSPMVGPFIGFSLFLRARIDSSGSDYQPVINQSGECGLTILTLDNANAAEMSRIPVTATNCSCFI